jgi:chaperonin GroEL
MEYAKVKSVSKKIHVKGPKLQKLILDTMKTISDVVGATLGPGGMPVLIERGEHDLPASVTKDGVTVFRSLGFEDSAAHTIMETARDAAVRTAASAGDGTTSATILAEAIVRRISEYCSNNPTVSPQKIVRHLQKVFQDYIEPTITKLSTKVDMESEEGKRYLEAVARISANGDGDLAKAVLQCFEYCGDDGNITINEQNGNSGFKVEKVNGFGIRMGFDESGGRYAPQFLNDAGRQRCFLEKPIFILYHGKISEIQSVQKLLEKIGELWNFDDNAPHNVVLVATGFSDSTLASLALNFGHTKTINVYPMLVPMSPQSNGQLQFLYDLSAITGARVLDQLSAPLNDAEVIDCGPGVECFESYRFTSTIVGYADETLRLCRIDELKQQLENPESELDAMLLQERIGKLAGGIAKLHVIGSSNGELREVRDRAEDAICGVRSAIKYGCLPGGGWTLMKLCATMPKDDITNYILRSAFMAPVERLLLNSGITEAVEAQQILGPVIAGIASGKTTVYDFLDQKHVDAYEAGLLDSTPAVLEAIRTSISIASQLGTLGGIVVYARDLELERSEASDVAEWKRNATVNEADMRP